MKVSMETAGQRCVLSLAERDGVTHFALCKKERGLEVEDISPSHELECQKALALKHAD